MSFDSLKRVPEPTLRRLPLYLHLLRDLEKGGRRVVSCSFIGRELQLDPTQVRKDLAATGIVGRPKIGYEITPLIDAVSGFLGFNNVKDAFLVGVGNLGQALLGFDRFNRYGLNIVAAFDRSPEKVGTEVHGKPVYALDKISNLATRMKIQLGVLTVPADAAQSAADALVSGGVRAIWNFAPVALDVPDAVIVQNEDLFASLAVLSNKLAEAKAVVA
jgi:redox-sensing transcriptional repressor